MVITGLTRNQLGSNPPRVRISPSPPKKQGHAFACPCFFAAEIYGEIRKPVKKTVKWTVFRALRCSNLHYFYNKELLFLKIVKLKLLHNNYYNFYID